MEIQIDDTSKINGLLNTVLKIVNNPIIKTITNVSRRNFQITFPPNVADFPLPLLCFAIALKGKLACLSLHNSGNSLDFACVSVSFSTSLPLLYQICRELSFLSTNRTSKTILSVLGGKIYINSQGKS